MAHPDLPGQQTLPGMGQPELTYALLKAFEKQPGCDAYSSDSNRIRLLSEYIWLRRLAPELTFEAFLQRYESVADFDDENCKHPDAALKRYCPRSRAAADKANLPQWSANEVVDILVLYVDMCREADAQNIEVPMNLAEYLAMDGEPYKRGEVTKPERPTAARGPAHRQTRGVIRREPAPADPNTGLVPTNNPLRPTQAQQRVIYEHPVQRGRQIKGVVERIITEGDHTYVDFVSDEGERTEACSIKNFVVCDEVPPAPPAALERKKIWVLQNQWPGVQQALRMQQPMANVDLGSPIYQFSDSFSNGSVAHVVIRNGETGPYVDPSLGNPDEPDAILVELPPRSELLGEYRFQTPEGVLLLEIAKRK
jgi:hypothetical protein